MIKHIYSYFVPAFDSAHEKLPYPGADIPLKGKAFDFLQDQHTKAKDECEIPIVFIPKENKQQNDFRDLLLTLVKKPSLANASPIAQSLWLETDARSGPGLLFILLAQEDKAQTILISRYSADTGFTADVTQRSLSVELIERIFFKNAGAYKAAFYAGKSTSADFWEGMAVDRQNRTYKELSDYWIHDFLKSEFKITPKRGSFVMGKALRKALAGAENLAQKEEIISSINLAKNLDGKQVSAPSYCKKFSLSPEVTELILDSSESKSLGNSAFIFDAASFRQITAVRSVMMHNGAIVSGPADSFEDVWTQTKVGSDRTRFTTEGKVVDEQIRAN